MSGKLRIFISSTMDDLPNERYEVCRVLRSFNMEPVNAEGWRPTGESTWTRIVNEIQASHAFILLLGKCYGWIPEKGPRSGEGLSVTHLEYREARRLGLPILPFAKRLPYGTDSTSEDARKRDLFREEVRNWAEGQSAGEFDLAHDLAPQVGEAVIELLTNEFLSRLVKENAPRTEEMAQLLYVSTATEAGAAPAVELPPDLVDAVRSGDAVLFAGAGMSLSAGLPSAAAFAQHLSRVLHGGDAQPLLSPAAAAFSAMAADLEAVRSRAVLVTEVERLLRPPQGVSPTLAHLHAVRHFDRIVTTNWDDLFEQALAAQQLDTPVITHEVSGPLPGRAIVKLHGSLSDPRHMVLTERDISLLDQTHPEVWEQVRGELRDRLVVVVGSSLRDPSIVRLFEAAMPRGGYVVAPGFDHVAAARLRPWKLDGLPVDANIFFVSLHRAVMR